MLAFLTTRRVERSVQRARSWRVPAGLLLVTAATLHLQSLLSKGDDPAALTFSEGWEVMDHRSGVSGVTRPAWAGVIRTASCTKTLAQHLRLRSGYLAIVGEIERRAPYIKIIDPTDLLCPGGTCADKIDGRALYTDGDHYSSYGNGIVGRYILDHLH